MILFENPPVTGMTSTIVRRPLRSRALPIPERGSSNQAGNIHNEAERVDRSPTRISDNTEDLKLSSEAEGSSSLTLQSSTTLNPTGAKEIDSAVDSDCEDSDEEGEENEAAENAPEVPRKGSPTKSASGSTTMFTTASSSRSSVGRPDSTVLESGNGHSTVTLMQEEEPSTTFRDSEQEEYLMSQIVQRNDALERTKHELEISTATCQSLDSQNRKLQKELDDAHSFIFTLQPQAHVITPSQALEEYKTLCMQVEDWVQDNLGDRLDKTMHFDEITVDDFEKFTSLVSTGRSAFGIPKTAEYVLIEAIMTFLCRRIFQLDFWCMDHKTLLFLNHIEHSMHHLEPRRGYAKIRTWRSETLLALASSPDNVAARQRVLQELTIDLHLSFSVFFPGCDAAEVCKSLQTSIIEPAANLAHKFHLSVDKFDVQFTGLTPIAFKHDIMTRYECQNINGKILKNPAAFNNVYIMDVCPGLYFSQVKADGFGEPETLKRPKVLVAATKPGEREWSPPVARPGHPVTLLAWLDETCAVKKQRNRQW